MSAVGIVAMVLGIFCLFISYRIRLPQKFDIQKLARKPIRKGSEQAYRNLYSTIMLIDGIILSAYGFIYISYPAILTLKVKIGVVMLVVIVNEMLRVLAQKYYA